jgi:hypothetical protein
MRPIAAAGLVALLLPTAAASALPLGHRGSVLVSGELNPHWSAVTIMPAVTRSTGVGPNVNWMEPDAGGKGGHRQELWSLLMLTQRLHRWNGDHYQANVWAGTGVGVLTVLPEQGRGGRHGGHHGGHGSHRRGSNDTENWAAWSPWVQGDWETQRLYLAASARWFQAPDVGRLMTSARAGVALTPADYDRWQPWLMLEANTMEDLQSGVEITPMLRLLHRRLLAEAGVSTRGTVRVNLTYTF